MTITLSVKETTEYAERCEKWSRERGIIFGKSFGANPRLAENNIAQAISDATVICATWEIDNPFPKLFPDA